MEKVKFFGLGIGETYSEESLQPLEDEINLWLQEQKDIHIVQRNSMLVPVPGTGYRVAMNLIVALFYVPLKK